MYVQLFLIWEFNIGDKKNSIHYYCWTVLSAILTRQQEKFVDTRTLSGNKFHSLLAWYRNEWRP